MHSNDLNSNSHQVASLDPLVANDKNKNINAMSSVSKQQKPYMFGRDSDFLRNVVDLVSSWIRIVSQIIWLIGRILILMGGESDCFTWKKIIKYISLQKNGIFFVDQEQYESNQF